jgi:protein-tyrosine phosphatase
MTLKENKFRSLRNFRDLGGIPAGVSRRVRSGIVYRSANPVGLPAGDLKILENLGIKTYIDLRGPEEFREGYAIDHSERVSLPLDFQQVTRERMQPVIRKKNSEKLIEDISNDIYLDILDASVPVFRQVMEILSDEVRVPILIHCHVGKDRTGIIVALLLMALGVEKEVIVSDFMKSNQALYKSFRKYFLTRAILTLGIYPYRRLMFAVSVKQRNIESVIDSVTNKYGGIEGYLAASGFPEDKLQKVRKRLLEG